MSIDWERAAKNYFDRLPHPRGHGLKIGEVATAVKLATLLKFGGHAELHEAALFWPHFLASGLTPDQFEQTVDRLAPLSYRLHGRPPSMDEIRTLAPKSSVEIRKHYEDLPSKTYPEITAGAFVKAFQSARPWARQYLGREPVGYEASYLHHSGESPSSYYQRITTDNTEQQDVQTQVGGRPQVRGVAAAGGQAADQRTPPGR